MLPSLSPSQGQSQFFKKKFGRFNINLYKHEVPKGGSITEIGKFALDPHDRPEPVVGHRLHESYLFRLPRRVANFYKFQSLTTSFT